jgi:release factor glutamine methyltransferase
VSIHVQVAAARQRLRDAGISQTESDLDARLLAQHALGWTTERFFTDAHAVEPEGFTPQYETLVARRVTREPLAYIVGMREFWGLELEVTPHVLIPRPATEMIVEAMLELFRDRDAPLAVADICTGCGCVAVAIADERRAATVVATDISREALEVARRNAVRHGVDDRVTFRHGDLLEGIDRQLDAIVANPPYVVDRAAPALQPEVRDYEPAVALFGGTEGFDLVTRLVAEAPSRLRPGGYLVFEFGLGQDVEVEELMERTPELTLVDLRRDLQGIARTAIAPRR